MKKIRRYLLNNEGVSDHIPKSNMAVVTMATDRFEGHIQGSSGCGFMNCLNICKILDLYFLI